MNNSTEPATQPAPRNGLARRIAITVILGGICSLALWFSAFNALTSLLAGSCVGTVILVASNTSDVIESVLETVAGIVFGLLAAIGAISGAVFGSPWISIHTGQAVSRDEPPYTRAPRCCGNAANNESRRMYDSLRRANDKKDTRSNLRLKRPTLIKCCKPITAILLRF